MVAFFCIFGHNFLTMKRIFLFCISFLLCMTEVIAQNVFFPTPAKVHNLKGTYQLGLNVDIKSTKGYSSQVAASLKQSLAKENLAQVETSGPIRIELDYHSGMKPEAYQLNIYADSVVMKASSNAGLFYAKEAFLQALQLQKGIVHACEVTDAPRFSWRGFMLDESRHFFGKEKVKQYLDLMASLRMNVLHWHLTDADSWRIEIKRYPKLTKEGAVGNAHDPKAPALFYTQEDIKEIVAYAAERQIMVVPEFDMPGHASAICKAYPEISGGGEGRWEHFTFHPCKEETFQFISNIFDELISLFPAPYIHIGGDEVHFGNQSWFTDPAIQQFIKDNNLKNEIGLEHYFIRRINKMLIAKGKITLGWDDLVESGISSNRAVVQWWHHESKYKLVQALEKGFNVIMTPRLPLYGDFNQYGSHKHGRTWDGYSPIEDIIAFPEPIIHLAQGYEDQLMGIQFTMWTERIPTVKRLDYMTFPRLVAVAESAWTPATKKSYSLFMAKLPTYLKWLETKGIYYFNPFDPQSTPEPSAEKLYTGPRL